MGLHRHSVVHPLQPLILTVEKVPRPHLLLPLLLSQLIFLPISIQIFNQAPRVMAVSPTVVTPRISFSVFTRANENQGTGENMLRNISWLTGILAKELRLQTGVGIKEMITRIAI